MEAFQLPMCEQSWESELPVENRIISATPGGGAGLSHTFCGNCTHSVRGARFSIFYYCESIISGLCFLATEGILAIVTVILIASFGLSGTLFLFCFFLVEIEERWSGYEVSGLAADAWSRAAVPIYGLAFLISFPRPSGPSLL